MELCIFLGGQPNFFLTMPIRTELAGVAFLKRHLGPICIESKLSGRDGIRPAFAPAQGFVKIYENTIIQAGREYSQIIGNRV